MRFAGTLPETCALFPLKFGAQSYQTVRFPFIGQVLGHLGFDLEDEEVTPEGADGKLSPNKRVSTRGTSQYLSWGGTSAMSFEVSICSREVFI